MRFFTKGEETIKNWTRGDLHGEWTPSKTDLSILYRLDDEGYKVSDVQRMEQFYAGNDTMQLHMTTDDALRFNASYREKQFEKACSLQWDTNLLNAFHNLHFILYMADKAPDFELNIYGGERPAYNMNVPGLHLWILQLMLKSASLYLRDNFIKYSQNTSELDKYSIFTEKYVDGTVALGLIIDNEYRYTLYANFKPMVKPDGTFGCSRPVHLICTDWNYNILPQPKTSMFKNMIAMRDYVKKNLDRFAKTLERAEFNRPENSLWLLNAKSGDNKCETKPRLRLP